MEHRGRKQDFRPRFDRVEKMLHLPRSARGDDLRVAGVRHRPDHRQIVTGLRPVARLAGRQDDRNSISVHPFRPFERVGPRRRAAAVDVDFVSRGKRRIHVDVDRHRQHVTPEFADDRPDQLRLAERRAADRNLVCSRFEYVRRRLHVIDSAADRERDRDAVRDGAHELRHRPPVLDRRRYIQKDKLISALAAVELC